MPVTNSGLRSSATGSDDSPLAPRGSSLDSIVHVAPAMATPQAVQPRTRLFPDRLHVLLGVGADATNSGGSQTARLGARSDLPHAARHGVGTHADRASHLETDDQGQQVSRDPDVPADQGGY